MVKIYYDSDADLALLKGNTDIVGGNIVMRSETKQIENTDRRDAPFGSNLDRSEFGPW